MFTPPESAKNNAQRVLGWKAKYGNDVRGMTPVGWARARQLASGKPISLDTVKRMASFARHRKNADVAPEYKNEPWKDAGYVAWLGWGGSSGVNWAIAVSQRETQKEAGSLPSPVMAHGPGGLLSHPGMGERKRRRRAEFLHTLVNKIGISQEKAIGLLGRVDKMRDAALAKKR